MKALNGGGNDTEILRVFTSGGFADLPVSRANAYRSHNRVGGGLGAGFMCKS